MLKRIDNQLSDAYFPSVFARTPLSPYAVRRMGPKPFIELGIIRRTVPKGNINTIRYAKILIQEFSLNVDKGFLLSIIDFISGLNPPENESYQLQQDLMMTKQSLKEASAITIASRPQKIFFEYIHLSPLKLHLSFSLGGTAHLSTSSGRAVPHTATLRTDIVDFFLNSLGVTLTEIKNVELKMAYFERKGVLLSIDQLFTQAQSHFTQQALQQAYVLILGLDVLGNPYGLVKDFTQGLGDFFYQPFLGSVQGRDKFTENLSQSMHSLMGNTVGSSAGSVAQISGGIGRVLASISFDDDYRKKRRLRMQQEPQDLPASLAFASKTLVIGVALGLSGVILDPIKGAHEDGVEGFFKGVGKGLLGLLTKPSGGIFDMVSMAFDGVRRSAEMDGGVVARLRLPRFINPQVGLEPYSNHKAAGMRLLQGILKGELAKTDTYWAHAPLSKEERANVLLITNKHILLLEKCRFWGGWEVEWKILISSILGVPAILEHRMIFRVTEDDSSVNLFSSGSREVDSNEADILEWLQQQITFVMKYVKQST
ncbi:hypothetical protein RRG08_053899 [Elysia crispata]|uniref:Intermembrane lipid transfer protein VPS13-like C-terminal domain-containing protein n=1 Tax=Elysia crispata TaxID=231223 RepID=A0AAE0ZMD0_9GAST|nr:hypothetical protein RRG08_053899 [Elysia crispata]